MRIRPSDPQYPILREAMEAHEYVFCEAHGKAVFLFSDASVGCPDCYTFTKGSGDKSDGTQG